MVGCFVSIPITCRLLAALNHGAALDSLEISAEELPPHPLLPSLYYANNQNSPLTLRPNQGPHPLPHPLSAADQRRQMSAFHSAIKTPGDFFIFHSFFLTAFVYQKIHTTIFLILFLTKLGWMELMEQHAHEHEHDVD